jgi:hypothetical protein
MFETEITTTTPVYDSGYTEERKHELEVAFKKLERRASRGEGEVTRAEFRDVVVPYMRCKRVSDFLLKEPKPKPVKPPRVKKPKKVTKKRLKEILPGIMEKLANGQPLDAEETQAKEQFGLALPEADTPGNLLY